MQLLFVKMFLKFAYCDIKHNSTIQFSILEPVCSIEDKNLIINNISNYMDFEGYFKNNNNNFLKIIVFLKDNFEIINISLVINYYEWGYIFVSFFIDENKNMIFDSDILCFNKELLISCPETEGLSSLMTSQSDKTKSFGYYYNIKTIMSVKTSIIYATQQLDKFIIIEKNGYHILSSDVK